MRLLLDTHALLWWLADEGLSEPAGQAIATPENAVFVSAASVWEVSIKQALGKLDAPRDLLRQVDLNRFEALPITLAHAYAAGALPHHHDDPFDRMLVAQAQAEELRIVTNDARLGRYGVSILAA